ncbi:MAG: ArgE/DapE family deacylase, partial [Roseomonas sp.]|nr:ArgE/DapE family deacylase [Roseomonas sp.]
MADKEAVARIAAAIDANFDKQVQFLAELVRFPSLRGREAPLQDWFARQMAARGYAVDRYTLADVPPHPKMAPMV